MPNSSPLRRGLLAAAGLLVVGIVVWQIGHREESASASADLREGELVPETGDEPARFPAGPDQAPTERGSGKPAGWSRPETEAAYFDQLRQFQRTDKERALAWARAGDEWFGRSGTGAEARQAAGITLLVDLGQMAQARREVREFIRLHPKSRYRPLVQGVTGVHPRPGKPDDLSP